MRLQPPKSNKGKTGNMKKNIFISLIVILPVLISFSDKRWGLRGMSGTAEFYDYVSSLPNMATTVDASGAGISISYKNPN